MTIEKIAVIGSGTMGKQIALNAAIHGINVKLTDAFPESLKKAQAWADEYLQGRIDKERMTEEQVKEARSNIKFVYDLEEAIADVECVIEVIVEDLTTKLNLFAKLDKMCPPEVILASNTSSFVPSKLAKAVRDGRKGKVIDMHFFNPVLVMKLVEIVRGPDTDDDTVDAIVGLGEKMGKTPVVLDKEINGFVVNRIMGRTFEEACRLIEAGIATPEVIDICAEIGLRHPMGPCKLMDLNGIDTCLRVREQRYEESQEEIDKPPLVMKQMVEKGLYGRKTGEGFYKYD